MFWAYKRFGCRTETEKEKVMKSSINMDISFSGVDKEEMKSLSTAADQAAERLYGGAEEFTGWVDLPDGYDASEVNRIAEVASEIRTKCTAFVVIGIGGSYLGARAAYELLAGSFPLLKKTGNPRLFFAGNNISAAYHGEILEVLKDEEVCLCVISKSGTTAEPAIAFALLKDFLIQKYGKAEAAKRIYAITDASKGVLRKEVSKEGYESFVVPDDIGGRYSILTPVGLLPLAVAGFAPTDFLLGAARAKNDQDLMKQAKAYAICRNVLYKKGKKVEIFESYEPRYMFFVEWLKQLFGESEGKEGVGVFPAGLSFSADLHSMGQFLQEGTPFFFETILDEKKSAEELEVPSSAGPPLAGKSVSEVNRAALEGVAAAHRKVNIPIFRLNINEKMTPQTLGEVVYFFETSCALSAYIMGVDPFDQPGVEAYKSEMRERL
ncbi:MAG: glucose-6-phosphate isomerase [Clostridia bacterium]|nr:glucose-6-phosphate isomerase [Clostridia bacterium]